MTEGFAPMASTEAPPPPPGFVVVVVGVAPVFAPDVVITNQVPSTPWPLSWPAALSPSK